MNPTTQWCPRCPYAPGEHLADGVCPPGWHDVESASSDFPAPWLAGPLAALVASRTRWSAYDVAWVLSAFVTALVLVTVAAVVTA